MRKAAMEYQQRCDDFAACLREDGMDAAVLFNPANIRYFSGFRMNRTASAILLVTREAAPVFIVPRLDFERARRDCWVDHIRQFPEDTADYLSVLKAFSHEWRESVGIEPGTATHHQTTYIKEICPGGIHLRSVEDHLGRLRAIKSPGELDRIRRAAGIADAAMASVLESARSGEALTEMQLTARAEFVMKAHGAEGASFESFAMSGENGWLPQRISTRRRPRPGELVLIDMGAIYEGYCSDMTRTFSVGGAGASQRRLFDVALKAQQAAIDAIAPGKKAGDVDRVAREIIEKEGYGDYFPHLTGHGIGLSIHESPIIDAGVDTVLAPGMVVTVEPGIYLPGVGAARVEDMVRVTGTGCDVLTKTERSVE